MLPGSQLLASADEQGNIAVKDLRMLGGSSQQPRRAGTHKGLPPPTSSPGIAPGAGSSWGSYSGNAAARGLVWEVRGAHQGQGVVRMIAGLRPLSDGTTGNACAVLASTVLSSAVLMKPSNLWRFHSQNGCFCGLLEVWSS